MTTVIATLCTGRYLWENFLIMKLLIPKTVVSTAVVASFLLASGCVKNLPVFKKLAKDGQTDCKACSILQVTSYNSETLGVDSATYTFTYNAAGDPVIMRTSHVNTGNPNAVFRYDRRGQLVELVEPYENQAYESWYKFVYNDRGQIIRDTQRIFGQYIDSVPIPWVAEGYILHQFTYDAFNRIVVEDLSSYTPAGGFSGGFDNTYEYDSNGDLIQQGVQYDSHLSLLRTNKIWMFLARNYSINNGFTATAYNAHDLPLTFQLLPSVMPRVVPINGFFNVKYGCR